MATTEQLLPANAVEIRRGASKTLQLTVVDQSGLAVDLTGATIFFAVKENINDQEPLISKSSRHSAEALITKPKGGIAQIYLIPADTYHLEVQPYIFDTWVVLSSGKRYSVIEESVFSVLPTVVRIPL